MALVAVAAELGLAAVPDAGFGKAHRLPKRCLQQTGMQQATLALGEHDYYSTRGEGSGKGRGGGEGQRVRVGEGEATARVIEDRSGAHVVPAAPLEPIAHAPSFSFVFVVHTMDAMSGAVCSYPVGRHQCHARSVSTVNKELHSPQLRSASAPAFSAAALTLS